MTNTLTVNGLVYDVSISVGGAKKMYVASRNGVRVAGCYSKRYLRDMVVSAQARELIEMYRVNGSFRNSVDSSPEPYRALIWESRMFPNMNRFDGSRAYHKLVDRIVELWK